MYSALGSFSSFDIASFLLLHTIFFRKPINYTEPEEALLGIAGPRFVSITRNGLVFDSREDFLLMPYIIIDAVVVPITSQQIDAQGSTNFMEMMEDMFDNPEEGISVIINSITEKYYELEYTFEIAPMSGYVHRKYDIETGLVILSHEDIDIFTFENQSELIESSEILLVHEDEKTTDTTYPLIPFYIGIFTLILIRIKRKKRN